MRIPRLRSEFHYALVTQIPRFLRIRTWADNEIWRQKNRIVSDYYDYYSKPKEFSAVGYLREIRLLYRLIFGDNERAHNHYSHEARNGALNLGLFDPFLDKLTKDLSKARNSTDTYSVKTEFSNPRPTPAGPTSVHQ